VEEVPSCNWIGSCRIAWPQVRGKNVEGVGEITIRELVRNALRMRPTRIIVGEVRGAEALDMPWR
jgi:type IV secretory pathway ATPase VirB11/archaellum biosynthesis ATPase